MIQVSFSSSFKRAFERQKEQFFQKLELFITDPFQPQLRTHKLSGNLKDLWSCSVEYDLRVIFFFVNDKTLIFEEIGSHDEVY